MKTRMLASMLVLFVTSLASAQTPPAKEPTAVVDAKIRLNKNKGAGFLINLNPSGPSAGSGSQYNNYFGDGVLAPFLFSYDSLTGLSTLNTSKPNGTLPLTVSAPYPLDPTRELVGLRLWAGTMADGSTSLSNLQLVSDTGTTALPDLVASGSSNVFDYAFAKPPGSIQLTGLYAFNWAGTNVGGQESYKFLISPLQGMVATVPEPSTLALAGLGVGGMLLALARRRRRQRRGAA